MQTSPACSSPLTSSSTPVDDLPTEPFVGVVVANELLDNLVFDLAERTAAGWAEVRVGVEAGGVVEVVAPIDSAALTLLPPADTVAVGARLPVVGAAIDWIGRAGALVERGSVLLIDYAAPAADLAARGGWLRTYAEHRRGADPYAAPGSVDITTDVPLEPLRAALAVGGFDPVVECTQAEWLAGLGIEDLVEEGRRIWEAGASRGDLAAIAGRSRAIEAATLTDPDGLGAFVVIEARR